jgi:hypothetical protein
MQEENSKAIYKYFSFSIIKNMRRFQDIIKPYSSNSYEMLLFTTSTLIGGTQGLM